MPKVGRKHFDYGPGGVAAAKREAARTGMPMERAPAPPAPSRPKPKPKRK